MSENQAQATPVENNENQETSQEEVSKETASAKQEAAAAQAKYLKSLKLKLDNKEIEETLPFEVPDSPEVREYLTRELQMAKMGQKRSQEYSNLQKEVAQFINLLKTNPKEALRHPGIGVDVKALAAQILEEEIENSKKSPEQLEKERLESELKAIKEEREREKKEFEERELQNRIDVEFQKYDDMIDKALEKDAELPKSPYVVKKIAEYMMLGIQNNMDVSAEDVLPLVKQEIQQDIKDMFGAMPDEVVEAFLGKERLNNIRKKKVAAAKTAPKPISKLTQDVGNAKKGEEKAKPMTYRDFFKI